jgi:hypothetical protein
MDAHLLILAVLKEASNQGIASVLKTTLIKFLYLLDVYTAEKNKGKTISELEWKFLHFGPYSNGAVRALDDLENQKKIYAETHENQNGDNEFFLYRLSKFNGVRDLRDLGLPGQIQTRIHADLKRYGRDLPLLLHYVYFQTTPMVDAQPGEILNFSGCKEISLEDFRPIKMLSLRPKAIRKTRNKLRQLIQERESREKIAHGPYDEVYYSALDQLDGKPIETGLKGKAKLHS